MEASGNISLIDPLEILRKSLQNQKEREDSIFPNLPCLDSASIYFLTKTFPPTSLFKKHPAHSLQVTFTNFAKILGAESHDG